MFDGRFLIPASIKRGVNRKENVRVEASALCRENFYASITVH
jgi:hypothetical protein